MNEEPDPSEPDEDDAIDSLLREAGRIPSIRVEPERVGQKLGRFTIEEELGRGGMGVVYAARDPELGRRVAIKVLSHDAVGNDERRRRFVREARAAATVSDTNLATVFEVGEADGTVYLAMELVMGTTLRARLLASPGGLPIAEVLDIGKQIARGLGKAHASKIVHRDLKPENVMLAEGTVKIVDFGLAKMLEPDEGGAKTDLSTQDGKILGTPNYMAPEQAKGERVEPSADVFSAGVVLYEMLTGTRPFTGTSLVDVLVATARDTPVAPSRRRFGIDRAIDRVVLKCLEKDPEARFADGDALLDALQKIAPKRTLKARFFRMALVGVAGVIGLAAVASVAGSLGGGSVGPTVAPPPPMLTTTTPASRPPKVRLRPTVTDPSFEPAASATATAAPSASTSAPSPSSTTPSLPPRPFAPRPSVTAPAAPSAPASVDPLSRQK